MPRGYRSVLIAAVGWLILSAADSPEPRAVAKGQERATEQAVANALNQIAAVDTEQAQRAESSRETEPCKAGEDKRYSDLCAQWKAADAAQLAAYLNVASIATVLVALWLAFQSNGIARDTARRQLRAYMAMSTVKLKRRADEHYIKFRVSNVGTTPAHDVRIRYRIGLSYKDKPANFSLDDSHWTPSRHMIPPSAGVLSKSNALPPGVVESLPATFASDETARFYVFGEIHFTDIFGDRWIQSFRLSVFGKFYEELGGRFGAEAEGNEEKRAPQPKWWHPHLRKPQT